MFTLPNLPYSYNALEPHIDSKTMEIHHTKHHAAYVNNLNAALESLKEFQNKSLDELLKELDKIPEAQRTAVRNNGGGHANHSFFWTILKANAKKEPGGALAKAINAELGGFANFKDNFSKAAMTRFGSGWAFLSIDKDKKLSIHSLPNQDSPIMENKIPVVGLDVWEHAYYLNYQNRRADYVEAFFNIINWDEVEKIYEKAIA